MPVSRYFINIGADIGALGAGAALVVHLPATVLMIAFTAVILFLEKAVSYRRYAKGLKWLTVSLLAYPITALLVHDPWGTIFRATFVPHIEFSAAFFSDHVLVHHRRRSYGAAQRPHHHHQHRSRRGAGARAPGQDVPALW